MFEIHYNVYNAYMHQRAMQEMSREFIVHWDKKQGGEGEKDHRIGCCYFQ